MRYNNLIVIYNNYICTFLSPSLKAAKLCFPKKIRLKKFAFSIYQQFPKMMSMDFYIRQVSQTAHGDCKARNKLPRNIRIFPDRHRQSRTRPPNSLPNKCNMCSELVVAYGRVELQEVFFEERRTHLLFGENIRTVSWGYNIGKSMLCSTQTQRLDHYIRCLLKRGLF